MEKKVKITQDLQEIELVGRTLGPFSEEEEVELKPWEAAVFEGRDLAEPVEDISPVGLRKILMSEEKSSSLEDVPKDFYVSVSSKIDRLLRNGDEEKAEKMMDIVDSLASLRVQKIARMAASSNLPRELPPEELFLMNRFTQALKIWRKRFDNLFKKCPEEEAGAHERGIRRSVQGIVRDAADIQE